MHNHLVEPEVEGRKVTSHLLVYFIIKDMLEKSWVDLLCQHRPRTKNVLSMFKFCDKYVSHYEPTFLLHKDFIWWVPMFYRCNVHFSFPSILKFECMFPCKEIEPYLEMEHECKPTSWENIPKKELHVVNSKILKRPFPSWYPKRVT